MYAYVHIEKTGGTTLHSILRRSFGTRHCDIRLPLSKRTDDHRDFRPHVDAADLRRARRLYRKLSGISGHIVRAYADLHEECPEIQFFTFLREPLAQIPVAFFESRAALHAGRLRCMVCRQPVAQLADENDRR